MGKFPGVVAHNLHKCPGAATKNESKWGSSPFNTSTVLFLCGISSHFVRSGDISSFIYLVHYLYTRAKCLWRGLCWEERGHWEWDPGSVCVWRPLLVSGVVSWRIISTCFLGAINLQGKEKSPSLLTFFIVLSELCRLWYFGIVPYRLSKPVLSRQYYDQVSFHFIL